MLRYKVLSFVVIICTIVSAYIMLSSNSNMVNYGENNESVLLDDSKVDERENIKENNDLKKEKAESNKTTKKDANQKEEVNKNKATLEEDKMENEQASEERVKGDKFVVVDKRQEENKGEEEDITDYPESAAVFKVESSKILENLSLSEKTKLLLLRRKISPVDYAKINNYLLDKNSTRGIIKTFSLLKERLSDEDYNEVKDIASKYINVDYIEEYISE